MKKLTPSQEDMIFDLPYHENKLTDTMICGLCDHYSSDMCFCALHPEWGELVEMDTCDDYEELP